MSPGHVGERLRQFRLASEMSMQTLATKSGFFPSLISRWQTARSRRLAGRWSVPS